jgi:hypothetical protein
LNNSRTVNDLNTIILPKKRKFLLLEETAIPSEEIPALPPAARGRFLKKLPPTFRDPRKNFLLVLSRLSRFFLKDAKIKIAEIYIFYLLFFSE